MARYALENPVRSVNVPMPGRVWEVLLPLEEEEGEQSCNGLDM
jgi:hypothetical protein